MDAKLHSEYASAGEIRCETTSVECIVEGLPDGTEYTVTVLPSYDLGWDDVIGGNFFQCDMMSDVKKVARIHGQFLFQH